MAGGTLTLANADLGTPLQTLGIAPGTYKPGGYSAGAQSVFMAAEDFDRAAGPRLFLGGASSATDRTRGPARAGRGARQLPGSGFRTDKATFDDNNALPRRRRPGDRLRHRPAGSITLTNSGGALDANGAAVRRLVRGADRTLAIGQRLRRSPRPRFRPARHAARRRPRRPGRRRRSRWAPTSRSPAARCRPAVASRVQSQRWSATSATTGRGHARPAAARWPASWRRGPGGGHDHQVWYGEPGHGCGEQPDGQCRRDAPRCRARSRSARG